ncbi:glycoside hydrolase family 31 protein, partial [Cylindrobasidium torrendii FP15055 ss-10]
MRWPLLGLSQTYISVAYESAEFPAAANSTGLKIQNGFERVYIQPYGENGLRVRSSLMRDPTGNEWGVLLDPPLEGPGGNAGLTYDTLVPYRGNGTIVNGNIVASVDLGVISFWRLENNGSLSALTSEYTDAKALPARYYSQHYVSSSFEVELSFTSRQDEQFYGAGQPACCKERSVNKKGQVVDFVNYNSHVTMPVYMSNLGYLQFFNMPAQGRLEFGQLRTRYYAQESSVVDYYITTAAPGDYDTLQKQYTSVTGRQPTPPEFLLGYQQSKLRYHDQKQVLEVAQRFHDEQIPLSLLVVDYFAWKYQGDWSFNPAYFPDPAGMAAKVKELTGAEMMVSLWPSVEDLSENYPALQLQGLLATTRDGTGIQDSFNGVYIRLIDSTNPASREFLWRRLNESYFSKGIHNFWIDQADGGSLGEPFVNADTPIKWMSFARTFTQYYAGTQEGMGMAYPWFHQQAIDEGMRNLTKTNPYFPSCPYMSLTRSTWAGGQRFCSYLWSGDTTSEWSTMQQQIASGVSVAASGISSWTLDIGGFKGLDVDSPEHREMYVRWFAMGVFLPYMRAHGTRTCSLPRSPSSPDRANPCPNEPWSFGEDNFLVIKKYIALRYQLVPYVARLFTELQKTGKTILRALYYDFSLSDARVAEGTRTHDEQIISQYMFGPRILVAPVYKPGVSTWEVYLPRLPQRYTDKGWSWKYWWTEDEFGLGGRSVHIRAPLDEIPVFYLGRKEEILDGAL